MRKTCQEAGERERDLRATQDSLESARQQINQLNHRVEEEQALSFVFGSCASKSMAMRTECAASPRLAPRPT